MIATFHDDETRKVWEGEFSRKLPNQIQAVARRKLRMINNARRLDDLRIPPQNRLEKLAGDREGQWPPHQRSMARVSRVARG
jgi:proteic killer suppression protein